MTQPAPSSSERWFQIRYLPTGEDVMLWPVESREEAQAYKDSALPANGQFEVYEVKSNG